MYEYNPVEVDVLQGKTLTNIDVGPESIMLTTECGRQIVIRHDQDCCESVVVEDTQGDWHQLVGKPIVEVSHDEEKDCEPKPSEYSESWTRSTLTFRVDDATVINRWIGESNGYYSESVSLHDVTDVVAQ